MLYSIKRILAKRRMKREARLITIIRRANATRWRSTNSDNTGPEILERIFGKPLGNNTYEA